MAFGFNNLIRGVHLRSGLTSILYFIPALYFQYVSDMKPRKIRVLLPPVFVYLLIFWHHIVLNRPVVKFRFAYFLDLLLTGLEIAAFITMWRLSSSSEPVYLSLAVFHITAFVTLLLIGSLKLSDVFRARKFSELQTKFNYWTGGPWNEEDAKDAQDTFDSQGWNMKLATLFSRFVFTLFIYLTVGFTWSLAIIGPLKETQSIPIKEYRSLYYPDNDLKSSRTDIWNVIVGRPTPSYNQALASAVKVILLSNGSDGTPCRPLIWQNDLPSKSQISPMPMILDAIAFKCPYKANVLVTVNFTRLGVTSNSIADDSRSSVQVMVDSATDNPVGGIRRTEIPILLIPGINLIGFAKLHILQKFKRQSLSTLGLFLSYDTFLVSDVVNLGSDPQASTSALISRAPDIATLRIIPLVDFSDWRIVQDYRDKSVLKGFSTVGGLWTFLGGIFAFLFGKSISYIAFNIKPLSTFGIVDQLCSNELQQQYFQKYAGLEEDMKRAYNQFMMDHFVDVEIIRGKQQANDTASGQATTAGVPEPTPPGSS